MALIIMFHTRNLAAVSLNDILFLKAFDHCLIRNRFRLNLLFFDFLKDSKFYKNIACASDILAQRQQISQLFKNQAKKRIFDNSKVEALVTKHCGCHGNKAILNLCFYIPSCIFRDSFGESFKFLAWTNLMFHSFNMCSFSQIVEGEFFKSLKNLFSRIKKNRLLRFFQK